MPPSRVPEQNQENEHVPRGVRHASPALRLCYVYFSFSIKLNMRGKVIKETVGG